MSAALTVSIIGPDFADVLVRTVEIPNGRLVTLAVGRPEQIVPEVFVVILRRGRERVQLGIESPRSVAVQRIDT